MTGEDEERREQLAALCAAESCGFQHEQSPHLFFKEQDVGLSTLHIFFFSLRCFSSHSSFTLNHPWCLKSSLDSLHRRLLDTSVAKLKWLPTMIICLGVGHSGFGFWGFVTDGKCKNSEAFYCSLWTHALLNMRMCLKINGIGIFLCRLSIWMPSWIDLQLVSTSTERILYFQTILPGLYACKDPYPGLFV